MFQPAHPHSCPNCAWSDMSLEMIVAAKVASLLSRRAAIECPPGREPGGVVWTLSPVGAKESQGICRTYGAHPGDDRNPRACARGYILTPLRGSPDNFQNETLHNCDIICTCRARYATYPLIRPIPNFPFRNRRSKRRN